ncbi:MAG: indolepyruvate oxidoreductase subunit beta [Phycisphaeraceae bacterium]|jgi:indolepyruvate ferredoxin oxidoreductase beta subunit|nr:indolepyruvate oxidoreductase subunit beta [Phycisphaeraceae bacterium]
MTTTQTSITSVILVGVGGQGILLGSEILARAAMAAGHEVKTNEVHGMAQRGGSVVAQVRFGREVFSPLVPEGTACAMAAFEIIEALRYAHYLAPGAFAAVAQHRIIPVTVSSGQASYPLDAEARLAQAVPNHTLIDAAGMAQQLGNIRTANVIVLGALSAALDLPMTAWRSAIDAAVKPAYRTINHAAFDAGRDAAHVVR